VFTILVFGLLAVLLVVAGLTLRSRNRSQAAHWDAHPATGPQRQKRKSQRAQSRNARRKRH
jgi:hypothetical protein